MPCCAFAAAIVAQLILGVRVIKRVIFGSTAGESAARNLAVEWRLGWAAAASPDLAAGSGGWLRGRRPLRGLALAAALELVIVLGAVYGIAEHLGHAAGHSQHIHQTDGIGRDVGAHRENTAGAPNSGA